MNQLYISAEIRDRHPYRSLVCAVLQRAVYDAREGPPSYMTEEAYQHPVATREDTLKWAEDCPSLSRAQVAEIIDQPNQ